MNNIIKAVCRANSLRSVVHTLRSSVSSASGIRGSEIAQNVRSLSGMCSLHQDQIQFKNTFLRSNISSCGCFSRSIHSKGEKELVTFLSEEIAAERKSHQIKTIPSEVDGFQVKLDGSEVTLTKNLADELITINFNVNHTVDTDSEPEISQSSDKTEFGELKSRPAFEIDIKRGSQTLSFSCSFLSEPSAQEDEGYNDIFGIDEVTMYEGEWTEKTYAVAGDVLDGYLYDLLMTLLEEKGISNEFVEKLSNLSTAYENSSYIALLENLQKFASGK